MKRIAIVGSGVAGLGAAHRLQKQFDVTIFESAGYLGGHTNTIDISRPEGTQSVDTGFIVFNEQTYPNLIQLFDELGVEYANSNMSFAHHNTQTGLQWCSRGLGGLFAQRKNLFSPRHFRFLLEALRFNKLLPDDLQRNRISGSFGDYLKSNGFSKYFQENFILPMTAAVWSTPPEQALDFPAKTFARFFVNHGFLSLYSGLQWKYVVGGSNQYVKKILNTFKGTVCLSTPVQAVKESQTGVVLGTPKGKFEFDACLLATHADTSLKMLSAPSSEQVRLLKPFRYETNLAVLHSDESVMPPLRSTWSAWNFKFGKNALGDHKSTVVYYMNMLQNIKGATNYFVSLNDFSPIAPSKVFKEVEYEHPLFTEKTEIAQSHLPALNETGNIFFSGSYFRYGFHEDAYLSAINAAEAMMRRL